MSDNSEPEPTPHAESATPTTVTNISGGVNLDPQRDVHIGGGVVGCDKTTANIDTGGEPYVAGDVNIAGGGRFVGRDFIQNITNVFQGDTAQRICATAGTCWNR